MQVKAWQGGGGIYGIYIGRPNRDKHFKKEWRGVEIRVGGVFYEINLNKSFWNHCPELRHSAIKGWLKALNLLSWEEDAPPVFELVPVGERCFELRREGPVA